MSAATCGVVARWTARCRPPTGGRCDECGTAVTGIACDECGQSAVYAVGMLATVVDTPAGPQLVIAERTSLGGWTPLQVMAPTTDAIEAVKRAEARAPWPVPDLSLPGVHPYDEPGRPRHRARHLRVGPTPYWPPPPQPVRPWTTSTPWRQPSQLRPEPDDPTGDPT
jgi:hypothetical protein